MPDFTANLAAFGNAKDAVDKAATHYDTLAKALEANVKSLRDGHALSGGPGITGMFQGLLDEFGREWLAAMDQFVGEEHGFVTFLQGFSTRLQDTHDLYQQIDTDHSRIFDGIGNSLGSEQP